MSDLGEIWCPAVCSGGTDLKNFYEKTVFLFFTIFIFVFFLFTDKTIAQPCLLSLQQAYKTPNSSSVYYITENCTKKAFKRADVFFTYFDSWNNVHLTSIEVLNSVPYDTITFMPWGPKYDPKYGALIKTINDAKVYLLLGNEKYWITSADVFNALNYSWNWIEDVDQRLLDKYSTASEINYTNHHPNYTLIKYTNDPKVYRLEPDPNDSTKQVKKWVIDAASFNALGFRWDRIVVIPGSEVYSNYNNIPEPADKQTLIYYQQSGWSYSGNTINFNLKIGEIKELSKSLSIRVENIDKFGVTLSAWSKNHKGCRIVEDNIYLKNIDSREKYSVLVNYFLKLETLNSDSVNLSTYTGNQAYQLCNEKFEPKSQCLIFPHDDYSTINNQNLARMFQCKNQYEYNNLMLNYQTMSKEKLNNNYFFTKDLYPIENTWNFITYKSNDYSADLAYSNYTIFKIFDDSEQLKLINDSNYLTTYKNKLVNDDLNFGFSTDNHEFIHVILYDTELNKFCKYQKSCYLTEGIAEYLQTKIKYSDSEIVKQYTICQKNKFANPGSVTDNMSYKDAFMNGYTYDAGKCFFYRYENECGTNALNKTLAELSQHQYEPTINYQSLFGILNKNCSNQNNYKIILSDFGFSFSLINEKYPLTENLSYKENGCIY